MRPTAFSFLSLKQGTSSDAMDSRTTHKVHKAAQGGARQVSNSRGRAWGRQEERVSASLSGPSGAAGRFILHWPEHRQQPDTPEPSSTANTHAIPNRKNPCISETLHLPRKTLQRESKFLYKLVEFPAHRRHLLFPVEPCHLPARPTSLLPVTSVPQGQLLPSLPTRSLTRWLAGFSVLLPSCLLLRLWHLRF